ncbi:hypothetical protein BDR04DRAFT_1164758 [Suillus decipiens]|nr:hypothetical protein BDR04DRAFT_1164758 [Suillus decipiens]
MHTPTSLYSLGPTNGTHILGQATLLFFQMVSPREKYCPVFQKKIHGCSGMKGDWYINGSAGFLEFHIASLSFSGRTQHSPLHLLPLSWMNPGNQLVEILIEDVYPLVVPSPQANVDPEEERQRAQAAKLERLENTELVDMRGQTGISLGSLGFINGQNNQQPADDRYEDNLSVPGHPFAAGITLAGFTAVSVNEEWQLAFIESTAGAISTQESQSMAGLPLSAAKEKFSAMISLIPSHTVRFNLLVRYHKRIPSQFILLSPVAGEGRIVMNHKLDKNTPHFDVQLLFYQIGAALDDN